MFRFETRPPSATVAPNLPLKRLPARASLLLAITSPEPVGVWTHFWSRRTTPCLAQACPACAEGLPTRYECYVGAITSEKREHAIYALTPNAARALYDATPQDETSRGLVVTLSRAGTKANGRLILTSNGQKLSSTKLPPAPDLVAILLHIWGYDQQLTARQIHDDGVLVAVPDATNKPTDGTH